MGKPIVYCVGCGRSLREDDFLKRRAQMAENRPWCAECRPISEEVPSVPRARKSSSKIPVPPTSTPRRAVPVPRPPSRAPLWAAAAGALVVLGVVAAFASRPRPAAPPPPRVVDERTERAVGELERFAATAAPAAILARCDALREIVRGTALERRLQAVEDAARRREAGAPAAPAVDASERHLGLIRELIAADRTYRRREEVRNMIAAGRATAGARAADFDRLEAEYERRFLEDRRRAIEAATAEARRLAAANRPAEATAALDAVPEAFAANSRELEAARAEIGRAAVQELVLRPRDARISGGNTFTSGTGDEHAIEGIGEDSKIAWTVDLPAGAYRVTFESACPQNNGGRFALRAGESSLEGTSPITGGWKTFHVHAMGRLTLPGGPVELRLDTLESKGGLMNLRSIRLRPE